MSYRTTAVPVRGGQLTVALWEPAGVAADTPTVVAIHGITSAHTAWPLVAAHLPGMRVVAPDLRGRGRSNELPGPYGMAQHAEDVARAMDHLGIARATVAGHSMGAFVAVVLAAAHPERLQGVVLVDGGLPLEVPAGMTVDTMISTGLGPAADRLSQTFPSKEAYRDFWRVHPSFVGHWSPLLEAYSDYDLVEGPAGLHPATSRAAMLEDARDLYGTPVIREALHRLPAHTTLLTAPRGLVNTAPLYPPSAVERIRSAHPRLTLHEVPDVNHYTIVMTDRGAQTVAAEVTRVGGASLSAK
jgi:pimeloyl-ACP methyl ester carboxylesterase